MHVVITSTIVSVIQLKLYILISSFLYILRVSFTEKEQARTNLEKMCICVPLEKEQACTNLRKMCMCASKKKNRPVLIWGRCVYASLEKEQDCSNLRKVY